MAIGRGVFFMSVAAALFLLPALAADAPPHSAPRTPVTVQPLPPVQPEPTSPLVPPQPRAAPAPAPVAAERPFWRRPELYALIALVDTIAASTVTLLYLRKPEPARLRLARMLTGSSAVFVAAALVAWLL